MSRRPIVAAVAAALAAGGLLVAPSAQAASRCSTPWGSTDREIYPSDVRNGGAVVGQRVGHHACYDRAVVEVEGPATLVQTRYRVAPDGRVVLDVRTRHDSMTSPIGYPPAPVPRHATGLPTIRATGAPTLGRTFTAVGLATRARLPYRVFALSGPGVRSRIVVDVAHSW